jgi:hypothetical protein
MLATEHAAKWAAHDVALTAINHAPFYHHFALPLARRHELIKAVRGPDEYATERAADYDYLAIRALCARNHVTRQMDVGYLLAQYVDMVTLARDLRDQYETGQEPQSAPLGGDLCRQDPPWRWGAFAIKPDQLGMLGGCASYGPPESTQPNGPDGGSVTFNWYGQGGFMGNHGPTSLAPEYCSVSGGPATIWTDYSQARFAGEFKPAPFWRWRDGPRANGGESFSQIRPVWLLDLNGE